MNYAQDRLDRCELQQQLIREPPDHTKYGQLCLRRGWNRHALYHYGRAWYDTPSDGIKLGDYVQMMEIYGHPEIALLTIFFYRSLTSNTAYRSGSQEEEEEYLQTFLTPPPQVIDRDNEDDHVNHNKYNLSNEEMTGQHCGCRDELCGRSISGWIPMPYTALTNIIEQLSRYLHGHHSNNNSDTFSSVAFTPRPSQSTTATLVPPPPTAHEFLGDWQSSDRFLAKVTQFMAGSQQRIPTLFQFWSPVMSTTTSSEILFTSHNAISFTSPPEPTYRTLPSVVQLLAVKLLYLVLPCLAMDAMVHLRYQQQLQQHFNTNDWDQLPIQYKSHWAYYIFLEALVFGERMKPSRRRQMKYQHVALWDRRWGIQLDNTDTMNGRVDPPQPSPPSLQPQPQQEDNFVRAFMLQLQHLIDEIYQTSDDIDNNDHLPPLVHLTPILDGPRWSQHHHRPLFFVGDSHVLSLAWQSIHLPTDRSSTKTEPRTIVPIVITGLKAWHVRSETRFFTNTCLHTMLRRIPRHVQTIIVSAGEIDCREGMGGQLLQGYTQKCDEHVKATVAAYVSSLVHILQLPSNSISQILITPVAPHIERNKGRVVGHASRRETIRVWNNELRCQLQQHKGTMLHFLDYINQIQVPIKKSIDIDCSTTCTAPTTSNVQYALNPIFNADSTHLNAAFAPILQEAIIRCQCDLSKL